MDEKTDNWQLYLMFLTIQFIRNDKKNLIKKIKSVIFH